ncbi:hypothetical protein Y032_0259g496 [Ancylostoma ceylanicum]|uniref:Uncharacterized protein n=1 Tax=Ancylostoma ceylanicum TaxID=53326 RepID=A0A016SB77_9BILA|nr:hypothetical protein Y032_0259g496 [Ancylostoma ceylanicum]
MDSTEPQTMPEARLRPFLNEGHRQSNILYQNAIEQNRKEVGPSVVNFDRIELENKITTGPELLHFSEQIFWRTVGSEVLALK